MQTDRSRVFYVQKTNLRINISRSQTTYKIVNFKRKNPIKYYPQGLHLPLLRRKKKYRGSNFDAIFLNIIFCDRTVWFSCDE